MLTDGPNIDQRQTLSQPVRVHMKRAGVESLSKYWTSSRSSPLFDKLTLVSFNRDNSPSLTLTKLQLP